MSHFPVSPVNSRRVCLVHGQLGRANEEIWTRFVALVLPHHIITGCHKNSDSHRNAEQKRFKNRQKWQETAKISSQWRKVSISVNGRNINPVREIHSLQQMWLYPVSLWDLHLSPLTVTERTVAALCQFGCKCLLCDYICANGWGNQRSDRWTVLLLSLLSSLFISHILPSY